MKGNASKTIDKDSNIVIEEIRRKTINKTKTTDKKKAAIKVDKKNNTSKNDESAMAVLPKNKKTTAARKTSKNKSTLLNIKESVVTVDEVKQNLKKNK